MEMPDDARSCGGDMKLGFHKRLLSHWRVPSTVSLSF